MDNRNAEYIIDALNEIRDEIWALREVFCKHLGFKCILNYNEDVVISKIGEKKDE